MIVIVIVIVVVIRGSDDGQHGVLIRPLPIPFLPLRNNHIPL